MFIYRGSFLTNFAIVISLLHILFASIAEVAIFQLIIIRYDRFSNKFAIFLNQHNEIIQNQKRISY